MNASGGKLACGPREHARGHNTRGNHACTVGYGLCARVFHLWEGPNE
jgi:hypothetical protein